MKTSTKPPRVRASDLNPAWRVVDAEGKTLGRLSSEIAILLQGKHKPIYVPNLNTGDFVIVINAEKVIVTGRKLEQKIYYRHSGYHGGLKEQTLAELMSKKPTQAIRQAVKGMLPKNIIGRRMLARLKLYAGASHPHEAQMNARPSTDEAGHGAETPDKTLVKKALSTSKPDATPKKRTTPKRKEPVGASMQVAAPKKRTGAKKSQLTAEVADTPQPGKSQGTLKSEFTKGRTRPRKPKPAVESSGVTEDKQAEPSKVQETEDA